MKRSSSTRLDAVRQMALALPEVEEATSWGSPSFKVRGTWLTCIPTHKSAEPDSLAVRVDFERRAELLENAPDVYYVKEHYLNYPVVLVRLSRIQPDALRDLLAGAWKLVTSAKPARRKTRPPAPRARRSTR